MTTQISTATNLTGPDISNSQQDALKFFNNFFSSSFTIGPQNDALVAYFEKYTGNSTAGKALASAVIYTAQMQGLNPMVVFDEFQKMPQGQLNNYLAAFLNFNRVPTSMIGIKTTNTNKFISRLVLP